MPKPQNFEDWIDSIPEDDRDTLSLCDAWQAGADSMLNALFDGAFIDADQYHVFEPDTYAKEALLELPKFTTPNLLKPQPSK